MPERLEPELALAPRGDDIRVGPPMTGALPEDAPPNPLELILDRLHGRWKWALLLALILAPTFATAGYFLTPVMYRAEGIVGVDRQLDSPVASPDTILTDFTGFVLEQTAILRSDRIVEEAMKDSRLDPYRQRLIDQQSAAITNGLNTSAIKGTGYISVQLETDDAQFAAAAVNCLLAAYMSVAAPHSEESHQNKLRDSRDALTETRRQIDALNDDLLALLKTTPYGTVNLQPIIDERVRTKQKREAERSQIDEAMQRIRESVGTEPADDARLEPTQGELDAANPNLGAARREVDQTLMQLELAKKSYTDQHPIYKNIVRKLEILQGQVEKEQKNARELWATGPGRVFRYKELKAALGATNESIERIGTEINDLNQAVAKADKIKRSLSQAADDERRFSDRIKQLEVETDAVRKGHVEVRNWAAAPSLPSRDRRKTIAGAGIAGGILVSFAFFFLWGSVDKRTFGTRQLAGTNPAKLLCAGAIPDMNTVEIDAEAKNLASNCVHRIRTRIESRRTPGDGYALMVSSPFQGDGKTTLAVALAWSYAESGYRTLLVDCDFIGQALSFQFGQLAAPGVREALQGADPTSMIATCGAPSLWILPVGRDRQFGASRVHPTGLRRLFRELRNRHDIIIVDTGPMTASIEALPVASAVDGVVLSLRRGRSRQRLDECIADIGSVGAEYLGVVLNYADRKDCMRYGSVSRLSEDITRALEGRQGPPPKHPLLTAISAEPTSRTAPAQTAPRREGDAA